MRNTAFFTGQGLLGQQGTGIGGIARGGGKKNCPACNNPSRRKGPKKAPPLSTEYCTDRLDSLKPAGIDAHIDASPGAHCTRSLKPCVVCYSVLFVLHIGLPAPNGQCFEAWS